MVMVTPNVLYQGYPRKNAILPMNWAILIAGIIFMTNAGSAKLAKASCRKTDSTICSKLFANMFFCDWTCFSVLSISGFRAFFVSLT